MVKVVMVTAKGDTVPLEFRDIYSACSSMHTLANSVIGGCAFTVSFPKEEEPQSRFEKPKMKEIPPEELVNFEDLF